MLRHLAFKRYTYLNMTGVRQDPRHVNEGYSLQLSGFDDEIFTECALVYSNMFCKDLQQYSQDWIF